jgi:hypothetical protein
MSSFGSSAPPQFDKAEYVGEPGSDLCAICGHSVGSTYYRVNQSLSCGMCAQSVEAAIPRDSHAAYVRALLFGAGGAVLGLIAYSAFGIITGLVIGYLSLGVGYLVGKAMMAGSKGIGGRRYQIAAVLFTYAAVSMSAIPMAIAYGVKHRREAPAPKPMTRAEEEKQLQQEFGNEAAKPIPPRAGSQSANPGQTGSSPTQASASNASPAQAAPAQRAHVSRRSPAAALGYLALIGLASPFLDLEDPVHGLIGLVILMVGVRIAWQLTAARRPDISGPFSNAPGQV